MAVQQERARKAAIALSPLSRSHRLVITHGSGPQVGMLAEQSADADALSDATLDVIDAQIAGMLGYVLMRAMGNAFGTDVVTMLTEVLVNADDPAFGTPTKPIGPTVDAARAALLHAQHGWAMVPRGTGYRRVVASPDPIDVVELPAIRALIEAGITPICAGGGGIPVVCRDGGLAGVEGVVDKDLVTSLVARLVGADLLVLLTDVEGLWENWGKPSARLVRQAPTAWARAMALESGSMAPKVQACCDFADATGCPAFIGSLNDAVAIISGTAGTRFDRAVTAPSFAI